MKDAMVECPWKLLDSLLVGDGSIAENMSRFGLQMSAGCGAKMSGV